LEGIFRDEILGNNFLFFFLGGGGGVILGKIMGHGILEGIFFLHGILEGKDHYACYNNFIGKVHHSMFL
jgi:hypothetical protein